MKKNTLRFIEDGSDVQALAIFDVDAESPCGVEVVPGENLMIQTQTASACEIIKTKGWEEFGKIVVKDQGLLPSLNLLLQMLEFARHGEQEVISATSKLQDLSKFQSHWQQFFRCEVQALALRREAIGEWRRNTWTSFRSSMLSWMWQIWWSNARYVGATTKS